jgi:transposase
MYSRVRTRPSFPWAHILARSLGRKAWLFAGSDRGGERAAIMFTLIQTATLDDVDPQAWLADDVLARIADHQIARLADLLPWNWRLTRLDQAA